jgi:hypothetical protein
MGDNCDQMDTSNFIRFSHGSDTTALGIISTNDAASWAVDHAMKGFFPHGSEIDSVKITMTGIALIPEQDTFPLCGWDCVAFFSSYLKVSFSNGQTAYSLSGTLIIESIGTWYDPWGNSKPKYHGTFNSNLYIPDTEQTYYVRDGVFNVYGGY